MLALLKNRIAVARGERPAELAIRNAQVWNAFTGQFSLADVAVQDGCIAGVGSYRGMKEYDAGERYLLPGFIDAHVHMESSMAAPAEFARALSGAGVLCAIADPHEIANVAGARGIEYMLAATEGLPLRVYFMLPSCVPATPLEDSAASLDAAALAPFMNHPRVLGLGEMMNVPGVLHGDEAVLQKLLLAKDRLLDGHAPGLGGKDLDAYAAAGIRSDHECTTAEEAAERLRRGMALMLREGSAAADLLSLLPAVTAENEFLCMFATDDRNPCDLLRRGSINDMVRMALEAGQPLTRVLRMASLYPARHFGLRGLGAVAPGFLADMALYPDLTNWQPDQVFAGGRPIPAPPPAPGNEKVAAHIHEPAANETPLRNSVRLEDIRAEKLAIPAQSAVARVIGVTPGQLLTEARELRPPVQGGCFMADPGQDILKLSVWERHRGTGLVGVGLVQGLGLREGAIGSTVAHDSHHLVAAGADDADILAVVRGLASIGGGLAVARGGEVLGTLPLPLGGLLSDMPLEEICAEHARLHALTRMLGIPEGRDPFMSLAFLSLPVIPALKLTCRGLVDVERFRVVPVSV